MSDNSLPREDVAAIQSLFDAAAQHLQAGDFKS